MNTIINTLNNDKIFNEYKNDFMENFNKYKKEIKVGNIKNRQEFENKWEKILAAITRDIIDYLQRYFGIEDRDMIQVLEDLGIHTSFLLTYNMSLGIMGF